MFWITLLFWGFVGTCCSLFGVWGLLVVGVAASLVAALIDDHAESAKNEVSSEKRR